MRSLQALAEHFGKGAQKYDANNWRKGIDWSLNYAALQRHITAWWGGDDLDEEGNSHLAAVMWHACVLIEYAATHPELDDRPTPKEDPPMADVVDIRRAFRDIDWGYQDNLRQAHVDWTVNDPQPRAFGQSYGEAETKVTDGWWDAAGGRLGG